MTNFILPKILYIPDIYKNFILTENPNFEICCNKTLYDYLNKIKSHINHIPLLWDKYKKYSNTYEFIHTIIPNYNHSICKLKPISRSFYKMIEIGNIFSLFEELPNHKCVTFHLAEGPGGFIEALANHRNNKNDLYHGMTLISEGNHSIPGWFKSHKLIEKFNIIIEGGLNGNGDLLEANNLLHCYNKYKNSCDLVTADGGFDFTIDFNKQEFLSLKLIYAQCAYAFSCQKYGGNFLIKMFDTFTHASIDIIYILSCLYEKVYFYKPQTSRSGNSEKYLICKNFLVEDTKDLVFSMHVIINLFKNVDVPKRFLNFPIPYKFLTAVQEINAILGQSQIETISYTLNLINSNNIERLETIKKNNISKSINWCHKYKLPYNRINNCNNLFSNIKNNLEE